MRRLADWNSERGLERYSGSSSLCSAHGLCLSRWPLAQRQKASEDETFVDQPWRAEDFPNFREDDSSNFLSMAYCEEANPFQRYLLMNETELQEKFNLQWNYRRV